MRVISGGSFFAESAFQTSQLRETELKAIAADVFTVRPTAALDPGEYLLSTAVAGAPRLLQCYAYGTAEKPRVPS